MTNTGSPGCDKPTKIISYNQAYLTVSTAKKPHKQTLNLLRHAKTYFFFSTQIHKVFPTHPCLGICVYSHVFLI